MNKNASKTVKVERKKSSQPLVTIVTITYNLIEQGRKDWFIQNLESVRSQTYSNIEHIVIDGASTDGTLEILEEYQNKGWIKYYSEPDTGIYDAMNKGILKAKGEYISFLNSDDFYHKIDGVQKIIQEFQRTEIDFCYGVCRYIKKNGDAIGVLLNVLGSWFVRMPFSHQALFVKTKLMRQLGGFDISFRSAGDYDFVIRMMLSGANGREIPYEFVSFRLGGISNSQVKLSNEECLKSFEKNYAPLIPGLNYRQIFFEFKVPHKLFLILKSKVSNTTRDLMQLSWNCGFVEENNSRRICFYPKIINSLEAFLQHSVQLGIELAHAGNNCLIKEYFFYLLTKYRIILPSKKIYRLFGFIPLFKISRNEIKTNVRLFCFIPFLKIQKRSENDTRVYLFSFIPVLRLKKTNRHKYVNLFNAIPLWKVKI